MDTSTHPFGTGFPLACVVLLLGAACSPGTPDASPSPAASETDGGAPALESEVARRAGEVLGPLKQRLQSELLEAMKEGPVHAIGACRLAVREIPARLGEGVIRVGRTSHRLRNPENAPEPWMAPLLEAYVHREADRVPQTVRIDDRTFGYVEPITTKEFCLRCHGARLDGAVREKLAELYPDDRATGFDTGDLRGMFWATVPVEPGR